ncbi:elongation factor P--(R)-beta-lysine ligase [Colwellia sp. MEBiC06753]
MSDWQPTMSWETAQRRAEIISAIRAFFTERKVIEVETPLMCHGTITDLHLDAITAQFDWAEQGSEQLYLQTSPEYAMKRLLASGYQSIYQISKAFRNEQQGHLHNPEFTMLEWYRLGYSMQQLMEEVAELLIRVLGLTKVNYLSYQAAFIQFTEIDPLNSSIEQCLTYIEQQGKSESWLTQINSLDTLLQFIFCEFIEPKIGNDSPCFIFEFPASQASLATINERDERVANRFECYFKGIELVNGFEELTDVTLQRQRFEHDNQLRCSNKLPVKPLDERFLLALEKGLPSCSGVALGVDRLVMLALAKSQIKDVITFVTAQA